MKNLFCGMIFMLALSGCRTSSFLDSVNDKIESSILRKGKQIFISDYQIRKNIIKQGYLFFVQKRDTLYILGDDDLPGEIYYGAIWTNKKMFNYSCRKSKIEEETGFAFGKKTLEMINVWDTVGIKKESDANYNWYNPSHLITAYRVYNLGEKVKVDRIEFRPFE